jgi:hypothetical protein
LTAGIFTTQQELIHQDVEVKQLDKELTAEVMEKVDLVCALFYITVEFFQIDSRVFFRLTLEFVLFSDIYSYHSCPTLVPCCSFHCQTREIYP